MDTPTFITVIGMWMLLVFGALAIVLGYRHRRAVLDAGHAERMRALEHGLDPPPIATGPDAAQQNAATLHRGVICIVVGLALMAALALNVGLPSAAWALPLVGFGLACLIIHRLGRQGPVA